MKVYNGSGWIATGSTISSVYQRFEYTAAGGETSVSGADDNANTLAYDAGFIMVFLNGVMLNDADYTATSGSSITGLAALTAGDKLEVIAHGAASPGDYYTKAASDAKYALLGANTENLIVNPEFRYDQESYSGTTGIGASTDYVADQWEFDRIAGTESARWTASIEASGGVSGARPWIKMLCTTSETPAAGEGHIIQSRLEAQAIQPLLDSSGVGAFRWSADMILHADAASSITFPATVAVFTHTVDGTARQYLDTVTITAADTWQRVTFSVPADATASINNDNGEGLRIGFVLMMGTTYEGTAQAWANRAPDWSVSGAANVADATNNYIGITAVKLEPGTVATPFVSEDYNTGLERCKRYVPYYLNANGTQYAICNGGIVSSTQLRGVLPLEVEARTTPTLVVSAAADFEVIDGGNAARAVTALSLSSRSHTKAVEFNATISGATTGGGFLSSDTTASNYMMLSARF